MRRLLIVTMAIGFMASLALTSMAGEDEAKKILEKAAKAHYPKGDEKKYPAYQGKNKGTLSLMGMDLEFTQEIWTQIPGKVKEVMDLSVGGQAVKVTSVFDGKNAWIKANDQEVKIEKEILAEFQEMAYTMGISQLIGFKDKGFKYSSLGEVQVNDKPAMGVKISKEGKKDINLFFDKKTGLLAKFERRARDIQSGQELTEERIITEYHDVKDRKLPKRVIINRDGKKFIEVEVVESRPLEKIDDGEFAQP